MKERDSRSHGYVERFFVPMHRDLDDIGAAMTGWLTNPPADLRTALTAWAQERDIEVD